MDGDGEWTTTTKVFCRDKAGFQEKGKTEETTMQGGEKLVSDFPDTRYFTFEAYVHNEEKDAEIGKVSLTFTVGREQRYLRIDGYQVLAMIKKHAASLNPTNPDFAMYDSQGVALSAHQLFILDSRSKPLNPSIHLFPKSKMRYKEAICTRVGFTPLENPEDDSVTYYNEPIESQD